MAKDAAVGSGTSSIIISAKNLLALINMAEDTEVDEGDGGDNETVKRSPLSKK